MFNIKRKRSIFKLFILISIIQGISVCKQEQCIYSICRESEHFKNNEECLIKQVPQNLNTLFIKVNKDCSNNCDILEMLNNSMNYESQSNNQSCNKIENVKVSKQIELKYPGDECQSSSQCLSDECNTKTLKCVGKLEGEFCEISQMVYCNPDLVCDETSQTCKNPTQTSQKAIEQTKINDNRSYKQIIKLIEKPQIIVLCTNSYQCKQNEFCHEGTCIRLLSIEEGRQLNQIENSLFRIGNSLIDIRCENLLVDGQKCSKVEYHQNLQIQKCSEKKQCPFDRKCTCIWDSSKYFYNSQKYSSNELSYCQIFPNQVKFIKYIKEQFIEDILKQNENCPLNIKLSNQCSLISKQLNELKKLMMFIDNYHVIARSCFKDIIAQQYPGIVELIDSLYSNKEKQHHHIVESKNINNLLIKNNKYRIVFEGSANLDKDQGTQVNNDPNIKNTNNLDKNGSPHIDNFDNTSQENQDDNSKEKEISKTETENKTGENKGDDKETKNKESDEGKHDDQNNDKSKEKDDDKSTDPNKDKQKDPKEEKPQDSTEDKSKDSDKDKSKDPKEDKSKDSNEDKSKEPNEEQKDQENKTNNNGDKDDNKSNNNNGNNNNNNNQDPDDTKKDSQNENDSSSTTISLIVVFVVVVVIFGCCGVIIYIRRQNDNGFASLTANLESDKQFMMKKTGGMMSMGSSSDNNNIKSNGSSSLSSGSGSLTQVSKQKVKDDKKVNDQKKFSKRIVNEEQRLPSQPKEGSSPLKLQNNNSGGELQLEKNNGNSNSQKKANNKVKQGNQNGNGNNINSGNQQQQGQITQTQNIQGFSSQQDMEKQNNLDTSVQNNLFSIDGEDEEKIQKNIGSIELDYNSDDTTYSNVFNLEGEEKPSRNKKKKQKKDHLFFDDRHED